MLSSDESTGVKSFQSRHGRVESRHHCWDDESNSQCALSVNVNQGKYFHFIELWLLIRKLRFLIPAGNNDELNRFRRTSWKLKGIVVGGYLYVPRFRHRANILGRGVKKNLQRMTLLSLYRSTHLSRSKLPTAVGNISSLL